MLSNKFVNSEKIKLVDNKKVTTNDKGMTKVLNVFFSNIIKTLNVPKNHTDSITEDIRDPTLKAMLKYRKHPPSILAIKRKMVLHLLLIILQRRRLLKRQKF